MVRHLTIEHFDYTTPPAVTDRDPAEVVGAAVDQVLGIAEGYLAWDGRPRRRDGNVWTPHKALRRVADHLLDHLTEIECRLAHLPSPPDRWHGRMLTLDGDWARFTEADLDEATSRLQRLAACYRARLSGVPDAALDESPGPGTWTIRQVVFHVAGVTYYAESVHPSGAGPLPASPRGAGAEADGHRSGQPI
jgi:hypothetical protein